MADEYVRAFNATRGCMLAERVLWAGTSETRKRGLLGRERLEPGEGAYIVPTQWVHMFGMKFAIDIAFLDGDGRVLHIHHSIKPNRLSRIVWRAEGALEVRAGPMRETGTRKGDVIELQDDGAD